MMRLRGIRDNEIQGGSQMMRLRGSKMMRLRGDQR